MGSLNEPVLVRLDALAHTPVPGLPLELVVETVWAITHFVYTNDNEVKFVRHFSKMLNSAGKEAYTTTRSFLISQASKPAEIAKPSCEVSCVKDEPRQLELDPSAPRFTQLLRKVALLVTRDDEEDWGPGREHISQARLFIHATTEELANRLLARKHHVLRQISLEVCHVFTECRAVQNARHLASTMPMSIVVSSLLGAGSPQ
ncbi:hypothetical protein S7711_11579 [Stachybotrys chartarum IBT 7711]|uniref:Uncharacterized protein n=1 Tax=Stachybotrys chartarum (strain CBS 109288 / IBT 7711) TaxID=1280523 RepID=A0A084BA27_STACB|nr:hypothetical protein S7711_11579 [Stachybotrys chartarum IBT 7711]